MQPTRIRAVVPGFFQRLAAFLIDIVAMYFLGYTLQLAGERVLLDLGPWLPFLSSVGVFCYFWLGNGPVGKGATFGKAIMNLHTVDAATGEPLKLVPSLKRAFLQVPFILPVTFDLIQETTGITVQLGFFLHQLLSVAAATLIFSHIYCILTHPKKRSWHEFWGGSVVTSDPTPAAFFVEPDEEEAERLQVKAEFSRKLSYFFLILIVLLMGGRLVISMLDADTRQELKLIDALEASAPIPGYRLQTIRLPRPEDPELYRRSQEARGVRVTDAETSDTVRVVKSADGLTSPKVLHRPNLLDGHSILLEYARKSGDTTKGEMEDRAILDAIDKVRSKLPEVYATLPPDKLGRKPPELKHLLTVFASPFRFAILPYQTRHSWAAVGPMRASDWPMEFNWVDLQEMADKAKAEKAEAEAKGAAQGQGSAAK